MTDCRNCAALAQQNQELRRMIEKQRKRIEKLQERIERARVYALCVYVWAASILCRKSGVPRGFWSFAKGAEEVARKVYNLLSE